MMYTTRPHLTQEAAQPIKSKSKIWIVLVKLFLLTIGLGFGLFSLGIVWSITNNFSGMGFVLFLCLGAMTILSVSLGATPFKKVTIDLYQRTISIIYFGLFTIRWTNPEINGYKTYTAHTRMGTYEATFVERKDGKQIAVSAYDLKNYEEMRDAITRILRENNDLRWRELSLAKMPAIFFGILWFLIALITMISKIQE